MPPIRLMAPLPPIIFYHIFVIFVNIKPAKNPRDLLTNPGITVIMIVTKEADKRRSLGFGYRITALREIWAVISFYV